MSSSQPTVIRALDSCSKDPYPPHRRLSETGAGDVGWLPDNYTPPQGSKLLDPPKGALGHPIVIHSIFGTDPETARVLFSVLTAFSSNGVPANFRNNYVELDPKIPLQNKKVALPILMLEHRPELGRLTKTSYIDCRVVYSALWRDLHPYGSRRELGWSFFRINKQSYTYLREQMKGRVELEAEWTWVRTGQLKEDFARRRRLETARTTTPSLYAGLNSLMVLILPLLDTIVAIFVEIFPQLERSADLAATGSGDDTTPTTATWLVGVLYFIFWQALTWTHADAATPEASTTDAGINAAMGMLTYMHSAAISLFLLPRLFVLLSQNTRRCSSWKLFFASVMNLLCVVFLVDFETQRTQTQPPAQEAAPIAPEMSRDENQVEEGFTKFISKKAAKQQRRGGLREHG